MLAPLTSSSQRVGNPTDIVGGYGTGRELRDVLAGGATYDSDTVTFNDGTTFDVGGVVTATVFDAANPGNVITVSFTIPTGGTAEAAVAQLFADTWNQTPGASNWMYASDPATVSGNQDVVLTGLQLGKVYTVAITSQGGASVAVVATQVATAAEDVEPGRVMVGTYSSGVALFDQSNQTPIARRFKTTLYTAMSKTWAVTGLTEAASAIVTEVLFEGVAMPAVRTVMDTDNNTTVTAHVAALEPALNALYGAGTGLVATVSVAGSVKIAVDNAGAVFEARTWIDGPEANAAAALTETGTITDPAYSFVASYLGVSSWQPGTMPVSMTATAGVYRGGSAVPLWIGGSYIAVECDDSPNQNQQVYVLGDTTSPGTMGDTRAVSAVAACYPDGRKLLRWSGQFTASTARIEKGS